MAAKKIEVSTRQFESSHGRQPRGWGLWWFSLVLHPDNRTVFFTGWYGDAVAYARKQAKANGCERIVVLP